MHAYTTPHGQILVNFTDENDFDVGSVETKIACEQAVEFLLSYPQKRVLCEQAERSITTLIESGACLHPDFFLTGRGANMNALIPERILVQTALGFSIMEALAPLGLFAAADRKAKVWGSALRRNQYRVLAAISMMIVGADDISELPIDLIFDVIRHFRTDDQLRWRDGLLKSAEMAVTAFRELARALGTYFKDDDLTAQARQTRMTWKLGPTWSAFINSPTPLQRELHGYWLSYSEDSLSNPLVDRQVIMDLDKVISQHGYDSLCDALSKPFPHNAYVDFLKQRNGTLPKTALLNVKAAKRFTDFVITELLDAEPERAFFPMITDKQVAFTSNEVGDQGRSKLPESNARPLPERFISLVNQILDEGAEGWPGRTFSRQILYEGRSQTTYCPVLPTLIKAMLLAPLRAAQFRRFDSGEGDTRIFNGHTLAWQENTLPNAGYWVRTGQAKKNETRGYAYEFQNANPPITGFYVNTNKTGSPYKIPWASPELHQILWELAQWQYKYNPVQRPSEPQYYLDDKRKTPKKRLELLPAIFALFRMPPTTKSPNSGRVVSAGMLQKAFLELLLELEKRWNALNPDDPITIITSYNKAGQPERAIYTLHGLRVRGITNLYLAGVPIEVISKIVAGHATVAMTLYYMCFDPAKLDKMLDSAFVAHASAEMTSFIDDFKNMKVAEARRRTTYLDDGTVDQIETLDTNLFCNVDIGVCPYSGERCGDGGALARVNNGKTGGDKNTYHPVPGGAKNCIMCRHFVSGTPFILPLELFGTQLLWKRNDCGKQLAGHRQYLDDLLRKRNNGEIPREQYRAQLDRLRAENQTLKDRIELIDAAIFRVDVHLTAASKILKEDLAAGRKPSVVLVASDANAATEYVERTPFELASLLTRAGHFWSILRDDKLEQTQQRFLDQIMFNAEEAPISLRADLTEAQRKEAGTLLTQFLMQRVSSKDRQRLVDNETNLKDLKINSEVKRLMNEVELKQIHIATHTLSGEVALLEGS